ncbi:hypothetical protein G7Y89_g1114 [Cudoniella acicularis]|uniref:Kinesin light chain n=1 Tax=Cudoniella acicularis TaxID=354080 RepID=A0A8H4W7A8_9HELO|nr:hypothetical protein G7Y89_g1114 [Cudoniella acicularis]
MPSVGNNISNSNSDPIRLGLVGMVYEQQGRIEEAAILFKDVYSTWNKTFGSKHPATLMSHSALASAYFKLGKVEDSIATYRDFLSRHRQEYSHDLSHFVVRDPASSLAYVQLLSEHKLGAEIDFSDFNDTKPLVEKRDFQIEHFKALKLAIECDAKDSKEYSMARKTLHQILLKSSDNFTREAL